MQMLVINSSSMLKYHKDGVKALWRIESWPEAKRNTAVAAPVAQAIRRNGYRRWKQDQHRID